MSTNPPGYIREYYRKKRADLIQKFGGECQHPRCNDTADLEFAHRIPNEVNGMGRGRQRRYYNIKNHPENYILLCHRHHTEFDNGLWREEKK